MKNLRKDDHDRMERLLAPRPGHPTAKTWGYLLVSEVGGRAKEYIAFTFGAGSWVQPGSVGKWHHFRRRDWALGWLHLRGMTHYKEKRHPHLFDLNMGSRMMAWLRDRDWPSGMRRIPKRVREGLY